MGTEFKILIDHDNNDLCKNAAKEAFKEASHLNQIFSDYIADSEISLLSESSYNPKSVKISNELFEVLHFSKLLASKTNNAFDPTLGQLSRLWRVSRFRKSLPTQKSLMEAMSRTGVEYVLLNEETKHATILNPGIILDLGGIAKGYTADKMLLVLKKSGIDRCLIDAGGDLTLGDSPRGKLGWKIEVGGKRHPDFPVLFLHNCSVATSGDFSQFVEINDKRYSHILDPRSGFGLENLLQVTVIATSGMKADSLATACSVLGPVQTKELLREEKDFRAIFISEKAGKEILEIIE